MGRKERILACEGGQSPLGQGPCKDPGSSRGRRSAHYKPNIWDYGHLQSLDRGRCDAEETVTRVASLVEDVKAAFGRATSMGTKLELVDRIASFGLSDLFKNEIENAFDEEGGFAAHIVAFIENGDGDEEGENRLIVKQPLCRRVPWFDVKWRIKSYEGSKGVNLDLLELAKLNFNELQAIHQSDLREVSSWWLDLGLIRQVDFTRDRLVESFLCALGLAHEPRFSNMRKSLTKLIIMVLVIDDVYDVFGSIKELECFTRGINRYDPAIIEQLPECMKACFQAVYDVTHEIARTIGGEEHWNSVLPHLMKAWSDFCNALFLEAKWDSAGYVPSLDDYLDNAWVTSSGPLISSHAYFFVGDVDSIKLPGLLQKNKDLIYNSSMIIRLCNDLATFETERDRGDAPSSVVCHMQEANVSEDMARDHIQGLIEKAWENIDELLLADEDRSTGSSGAFIDVTVNIARVAHTIYQFGDSFGKQDHDIQAQILSTIIEPFKTGLDGAEVVSDNV